MCINAQDVTTCFPIQTVHFAQQVVLSVRGCSLFIIESNRENVISKYYFFVYSRIQNISLDELIIFYSKVRKVILNFKNI